MKISIAMATYNGAKYILDQLNSYAAQKRLPDELIICDDCSEDKTIEIIEEFKLTAPFPISLIQNRTNLGFVKNFEKALSLCTGDIIFLSDQDDVWMVDKVAECEKLFQINVDTLIVINDAVICNGDLIPTAFTKIGQTLKLGLNISNFITGCCCAIRKELLDVVLPIPSDIAHDEWINSFGNIFEARTICHFPLQYYRRHYENTSSYITSSLVEISKFDLIKLYGLKDSSEGWKRSVKHFKLYIERLNEKEELINIWGKKNNADESIRLYETKIKIINKRIEIVSLSRMRRIIPVLRFWINGNYKYLSGWKSTVKDLIRN
jgi:glycosyltransferase involved in cell wall biosynthesis